LNKLFLIFDDKKKSNNLFFKTVSENLEDDIDSIQDLMPNDKVLFVFSDNTNVKKIKEKIDSLTTNHKNVDIYFFIAINLKTYFENINNCIFFPLKINDLKSILNQESLKSTIYKNLELNNNILKNINNNKSVNLSDIEREIIKLLFFKNSIQKKIIKVSILKYKIDIKSNSVESHLSRIRNKIETVDSNLKIFSNETGVVSIS
tara:strand:+ start:203 stop:814 length:612 start_codon:yes stop_codon:yes gene_type:complete